MKYIFALALAGVLAGCITNTHNAPIAPPPYIVHYTEEAPNLDGEWDDPTWSNAEVVTIDHWYPISVDDLKASNHRPPTMAKVLWGDRGLYLLWKVDDQYVRSIATEYRGKVWEDAAVEFFVAPVAGRGYFNFETNCAGTLLLSYHESKSYTGPRIRERGAVPWTLAQAVDIHPTMPATIEPENPEPVTWTLAYFIPWSIFQAYLGPLGDPTELDWRANFYKCAETNSHPHWGAWSPLGTREAEYHAPEWFGPLQLVK